MEPDSRSSARRHHAPTVPGSRADLTTDYFWSFPNWMLNCYPDNVSLNIILPLEPERTLAIFDFYLPESALTSSAARDATEFSRPGAG